MPQDRFLAEARPPERAAPVDNPSWTAAVGFAAHRVAVAAADGLVAGAAAPDRGPCKTCFETGEEGEEGKGEGGGEAQIFLETYNFLTGGVS